LKNPHADCIVIVGGYGFDDLGDDLILRAALYSIRRSFPDAEVIVLSNNPYETARRHPGERICFSPEALVRQVLLRFVSRISEAYRSYVLDIPGDTFSRVLFALRKGSLFLSLGGGYLNDNSRTPYPQLRLAELAAFGLCGRKLVMCAQEVGPFTRMSSILLAKLAMKTLTYATVRDTKSLGVMSDLGFPKERMAITADESWAYDRVTSTRSIVNRRRKGTQGYSIGVNLLPIQIVLSTCLGDRQIEYMATKKNAQILAAISNLFDMPEYKQRQVSFLSMSSADAFMAERLRSILRGRTKVHVVSDLDSQYGVLARSDILIGMRMHSIIMAGQAGVPPIAIVTAPKVRETMSDLGLSEYALDIQDLTTERLLTLLSHATTHSEKIRHLLRDRIKRLNERAQHNMALWTGSPTSLSPSAKQRMVFQSELNT